MNIPVWLKTVYVRSSLILRNDAVIKNEAGQSLVTHEGAIDSSVIDTDANLAANSDAVVPSQKAVKTYIDTLIAELTASIALKADADAVVSSFNSEVGAVTVTSEGNSLTVVTTTRNIDISIT